MKTLKDPGVFLAQFIGDSIPRVARLAGASGFEALEMPGLGRGRPA